MREAVVVLATLLAGGIEAPRSGPRRAPGGKVGGDYQKGREQGRSIPLSSSQRACHCRLESRSFRWSESVALAQERCH